ncbi:hypothetical protein FB381_4457 [Nocardioides albertanoniae]|uniref:DUF4190 domain-containing protein n=1 Tax=Nocardioides albertanoniae TaxID=1175486 RepID=A0A543AD62_9ACTN|nr:DUF4190 domain-containing protein [Nocardioides albertanoniae]TQL70521.1 hypothetical protein FB381_4457 [Nocardioides albertanoniae]
MTTPPPENQPGYGQPAGYGATPQPPYAQAPYGYPQAPPHPEANTAMVFGIVGLCLSVMCGGIGVFVAPFGWAKGRRVMREIDANPAAYSGRGNAQAGFITGLIGTIFGGLYMLFWIAYIVFIIVMVVNGIGESSSFDSVDAMLGSRL